MQQEIERSWIQSYGTLVLAHWFRCLPLEALWYIFLKVIVSKYVSFEVESEYYFPRYCPMMKPYFDIKTLQVAASMQKETDGIPSYPNLPSKLICMLHNVTLHVRHLPQSTHWLGIHNFMNCFSIFHIFCLQLMIRYGGLPVPSLYSLYLKRSKWKLRITILL